MRDQLLGFLLQALEPDEHAQVAERLANDPQLVNDMSRLRDRLAPLAADKHDIDPPPGLAARTCQFVAAQAPTVAPAEGTYTPRLWRIQDFAVAAGIFIAASLVFFPAVVQSRQSARLAGCQNNMQHIGHALATYADWRHKLPPVPMRGNLAVAGVYAPMLLESGYLDSPRRLICSSSSLANERIERWPTLAELRNARGADLKALQRRIGGSYGYVLGYVKNGKYYPVSQQVKPRYNYAILADAPSIGAGVHASMNHGGCGQNVLFEDLRVAHLRACQNQTACDDFFVNDDGVVAAGKREDDSVIAPSDIAPLEDPDKYQPSELMDIDKVLEPAP